MELCLYSNNIREVNHLPSIDLEIPSIGNIVFDKNIWKPSLPINRIYFGNEFCEHLIPSIEIIEKLLKFVNKNSLSFTLLTPHVSDMGISQLIPIFDIIYSYDQQNEIVFNDLGVLYLLNEKYPKFTKIVGRLIDKMYKLHPVIYEDTSIISNLGIRDIGNSNISSKWYQKFLEQYNIKRIELDNPPQKLYFDNKKIHSSISIYYPFGYITTGRHCLFQMNDLEIKEKFNLNHKRSCRKDCKKAVQIVYMNNILKSHVSPYLNSEFYRIGNTIFYSNFNINDLKKHKQIDRIIYQKQPPM